jgi:hypothetical protein
MSKPSETDQRYDRYAQIFENPVTVREVEEGNRAQHWSFFENFAQSTGRLTVTGHAQQAVDEGTARSLSQNRALGAQLPGEHAVRDLQRRMDARCDTEDYKHQRPRPRRRRSR